MLRLQTLGALELPDAGYANPKPLLLLTFLAIEGSQPRRRLASLFWPFASDPLNRLSVTASRLNKSLTGVLVPEAKRLSTPVGCDAVELLEALASGDFGSVDELYRGRFLDGVDVAGVSEELLEWIEETGDRLARGVQELCLTRAEALAAHGSFQAAAGQIAAALARTEPSTLAPERLLCAHDLLLAGGDPLASILRADLEGLGLAPASTRAEARRRVAPRARGVSPGRGWQAPDSPTLGRDGELEILSRLLTDEGRRLVTVTGPGGIGKTRLAVTFAERLARERPLAFPGGAAFVDCSRVDREPGVLAALYERLRLPVPPAGPAIDHLAEQLAGLEPALVLLDGCEHLSELGPLLTRLMAACPSLSLLLTSLQPLGLRAEWVVPLRGLPDPDEGGDDAALRLFAQRARRLDAGFALTASDAPHVASICRLTGGNPLALELAAGWVALMPVADIAQEVGAGLDILVARGGDVDDRHRSIRAVLERSWSLLEERERGCLRRLSVFRGGFDRAAAAAVAGAGLDDLAALSRKSMVARQAGGRFEVPDTLRRFVLEGVAGDAEIAAMRQVAARHADHLAGVVRRARQQVNQADARGALDRLDAERANIAAAMDWALRERQLDVLLGFIEGQSDYWVRRGALALAVEWYRTVEDLASANIDPRRLANVLRRHAFVSFTLADFDAPARLLDRSLSLCRGAGDAEGEARTYSMLGILAVYRGDLGNARDHYLRALSLAREHGLEDVLARALNNLGDVHAFEEDLTRANAYYQESLAHERQLADLQMVSNVLGSLGMVALEQGRPVEAERSLRESLRLVDSLGITFSLTTAFEQYASLFATCDRPLLAATLLGAATSLRLRLGTPLEPFAAPRLHRLMARARASVSADEFAEHLERGGRLEPWRAVELALGEGAALFGRPDGEAHLRLRSEPNAAPSAAAAGAS